jgi:cell division protein FtsQ
MKARRGRRRSGDLRPTWEERQAGLESVRERLYRQGADERQRSLVHRTTLPLAAAAFAAGIAASEPLLARAAAAHPDLFVLRRVAVAGAVRLSAEEVARTLGPSEHATPESVAARLAEHPWIASARAARAAPDTLVVRVVERVPAAVWVRPDAEALLVDALGTPFAPAVGADDLPRLLAEGAAAPDAPDPRLAQGVLLARAAEDAGFASLAIELDGADPGMLPTLHVAGVAARIVLGEGDPAGKLASLARLLSQVPESRAAAEIDLRFAGQVVLRPASAPEAASGTEGGEAPAGGDGGPDDPEGQALRAGPDDPEGQALRAGPDDPEGQALRAGPDDPEGQALRAMPVRQTRGGRMEGRSAHGG